MLDHSKLTEVFASKRATLYLAPEHDDGSKCGFVVRSPKGQLITINPRNPDLMGITALWLDVSLPMLCTIFDSAVSP